MKWLTQIVEQLIPLPEWQSAADYLKEVEGEDDSYASNKKAVEQAAAGRSPEIIDRLYSHAKDYSAMEDRRADSIISRGQSLLMAQSLLAGILTFGGTVFSHDRIYPLWAKIALAAFVIALALQAVLLSINATRAMRGLGYQRVGSSDLAKWLPRSEKLLVKNLALITLDSYVRSTYTNDWRFLHLTRAQNCLRNIVLILAMMVSFSFYTSLYAKRVMPDTPLIRIVPECCCHHTSFPDEQI